MSSQDLVDFYVEKLSGAKTESEIRSVIAQAVNDTQLLLHREIFDTVVQHKIADKETIEILELLTFGEYTDSNMKIRQNELVCKKLRILTIFSVMSEIGISVPIDVLLTRLELAETGALFSLLLEMVSRRLVDVMIDERGKIVIFTAVYFFREIPRYVTVDDIRSHLHQFVERLESVNFSTLPDDIVRSHKILSNVLA